MSGEATNGSVRASDVAWPRRPLTAGERQRLAHTAHMGPMQLVWAALTVLLAAGLGLALGQLSRCGGDHEDVHRATLMASLVFAVLGAVVAMVMSIVHRNITLPFRVDLYVGHVEVIDVAVSRAVDLGSAVSPAWLLEVGDGRLLFLCGRWLLDPTTYGGAAGSFPRTRLTVARAPASGAVVGLTLGGDPVSPEHYDLPDHLFGAVVSRDSEIIEGTLEALLRLGGAAPRGT
jgi:hypothetical protein